MTGFGGAERSGKRGKVQVELRSYNHRFLDIRLRLPRVLQPFEPRIFLWARDRLVRGRVEISMQWSEGEGNPVSMEVNEQALAFYLDLEKRLRGEFGVKGSLDVATLIGLREVVVFAEETVDLEPEWPLILEALEEGAARLEAMQEAEGRTLQADLLARVRFLSDRLDRIEETAKGVPDRYRERLEERISRLVGPTDLDPQRIAQEVAICADKMDVTEEIVRLRSHLDACGKALEDGSMTGKRLEFLLQEIGRELNTVGSKTPCAEITYLVVDMKSELEKIREQSQNIQ